jgi:tetratricopeptide (TPR) repeat protein
MLGVIILLSIELLNEGNELYRKGNYFGAVKKYEKIIEKGVKNHIVYYNLGNAYFKLGEIGEAILWYKRARKINPMDKDVLYNLEFARKRRKGGKTEGSRILNIVKRKILSLGVNFLVGVSIFLYLGIIGLGVRYFFKKEERIKKIMIIIGSVLVIVVGVSVFNIKTLTQNEGVVLTRIGEIRSGPGEGYSLIVNLYEGEEFIILEEYKGWVKILTQEKIEGWLKKETIGVVFPYN